MLEQFYGLPLRPQLRPQTALGSGFVIREDGLILTNYHVIQGADKIQVQFEEKGKIFEAQVIGGDDRSDIALLKIKEGKFPTLRLGNSDEVKVGQWVAAFGNPFGNGHTMTKGIISAIGRNISEINKFPLLQTDAPINPGNSGGPLVNLKGEVIGVNSAVMARAQGIGYAIPINGVKKLIPQLEKSGSIKKGYLGIGLVDLADVDPQSRSYLGIKESLEGGVIVNHVESGSPASQGGLRVYDVIIEFDGKKVVDANQFVDLVGDAEIGKKVNIKVLREGKARTLTVEIGERPGHLQRLKNQFFKPEIIDSEVVEKYGFEVIDSTPEKRKQYGIPDDVRHPIVVHVRPGSSASASGMLPGDVILDINKEEVKSSKEVVEKLKSKKDHLLRIYRAGMRLFLKLKSHP
ncbi:MAG: trypsin-like peptidase domain-containing protein, partial [Bdellovibrionaceae bacterium]|nr:trypsin-like peptidase domain-containing protein [Pseudobdellovibrionaceae bacterium]MDW8191061.1 trypsin-like peptidase domain-containing protein [Pseudobdellovibrionaceae bacterium]